MTYSEQKATLRRQIGRFSQTMLYNPAAASRGGASSARPAFDLWQLGRQLP